METDDWAQRAHAGFFSSPRTVVSEDEDPPSFFAPAWANPPPAPVLALASDTLTPRYSGATSGPTPRGFVPTSRGSSLSRTALGRADPWTPDVPPSCGPDRAEGGSLSRLRPRPLSFALEVASAMVPQALFGGQSKDSGSGLNEHPPLAQIPADSKHVNLKTPESVRGGGESSATKVSGSRGGRSRAGSAAKSRKLDDEERRDLLDSDVIWGTTINCLPDEVLLHVLKFVQTRERRNQPIQPDLLHPILMVNRRFCLLAATLIYQNPRPTTAHRAELLLGQIARASFEAPLSVLSTSIRHMDLSRAYQQGANLDLAALSACYRLQTLNVSNAASLTGLESLFRTAFPRLHTLTARDSAAVDDSLIRALCSRDSACVSSGVLKRLDFAGCNGLTDDGVCHVVEVLGDRLTTLKVGRCQSITDAAVSRIAEGCPRLVELDLEKIQGLTVATMFGKLILHRQSACRELTALSLSGVKLKEDGHQLAAFQTWAGDIASHASRPFHPGSPGEGRITLPVRAPRTTPKTSLKSLNVSGIPFLTAPVLNILLAHNPKLDVLRVSHCAGIAESSISHFREIAPACLNMRTLSLSRTPLPGTVLSKMLSPKLAVLDLSDNSIQARQLGTVLPHALTDATVAMICNNCPNLRAIHLARNGQLTDQTLFALMALYRTLRKVSLQRCRLMTAGNLRGFLNVCGRLEWLDLSEIPDICRWQELRELGSVKDRPQGAIDMEQDTSLILEGYTAMTKARALLNDMLLLFLAPVPSMPVGEDVLDDHPPSNPLSAWSSARTTPSKSSKSASINTSCCPSDAESGSEDGSERTADGLLRPAIRRSRRLRKIARNGQCYRHRNKYHALPDLPTAKGPAGRLRARAAANRTPLSERSGSTDSTPSDAGIGNLEATGDSAPIVAEQMPSPRRKELAHLFAALSSDAGYEE